MSPDGLLQQSSTVADSVSFQFSDGITELVPCSYIEFAERLVLPQYKHLPHTEVSSIFGLFVAKIRFCAQSFGYGRNYVLFMAKIIFLDCLWLRT